MFTLVRIFPRAAKYFATNTSKILLSRYVIHKIIPVIVVNLIPIVDLFYLELLDLIGGNSQRCILVVSLSFKRGNLET